MVLRWRAGMILSVSTLTSGNGAAIPVSLVNGCIGLVPRGRLPPAPFMPVPAPHFQGRVPARRGGAAFARAVVALVGYAGRVRAPTGGEASMTEAAGSGARVRHG